MDAAALRVVAAHCREEIETADATREMLVLALLPFQLAVIEAG